MSIEATTRTDTPSPAINPYDEVPYPASAHPQTHPDRLAMIGTLFGMRPVSVTSCRVLELGCADGSNLIPMAENLPDSEFVGIDLSEKQVAAGCELIERLELANIRISQRDIAGIADSFGKFDYIVAHGVFSWVPRDVQEEMFALCRRLLTSQGIAYISYNTNPGWRMRGMLRDMMLYHTRRFSHPQEKVEQARALIQFLAKEVPKSDDPYGLLLRRELDEMRHWDDSYLLHDSLEEVNDPIYFHQFIERAAKHHLCYLAESEFQTMLLEHLPKSAAARLESVADSQVDLEQYMDFIGNRTFRQTLLCHEAVEPLRNVSADRIRPLHFAAKLEPAIESSRMTDRSAVDFCVGTSSPITVRHPLLKNALLILRNVWPASIAFNDLFNQAHNRLATGTVDPTSKDERALASMLLRAYAACLVRVHSSPQSWTGTVSDRPCTSRLARWQAQVGRAVTNQLHEDLVLDQEDRRLLATLDGTQSIAELAGSSRVTEVDSNLELPTSRDDIQSRLARFSQQALLVR